MLDIYIICILYVYYIWGSRQVVASRNINYLRYAVRPADLCGHRDLFGWSICNMIGRSSQLAAGYPWQLAGNPYQPARRSSWPHPNLRLRSITIQKHITTQFTTRIVTVMLKSLQAGVLLFTLFRSSSKEASQHARVLWRSSFPWPFSFLSPSYLVHLKKNFGRCARARVAGVRRSISDMAKGNLDVHGCWRGPSAQPQADNATVLLVIYVTAPCEAR